MASFQHAMTEYQEQLEKGLIQTAYKGLMEYMLAVKASFAKNHPEYSVSSSLYFGYMDMTYFALIPAALKIRELKLAIVFLHQECRFEAWLSGTNKQIQAKYWKIFQEKGWKKYPVVDALKGRDAIIEHVLIETPDFNDLAALTSEIEDKACTFTRQIEAFLLMSGD